MSDPSSEGASDHEFGPIFSRIYSFFSARSRSSRKLYLRIARKAEEMKSARILDVGCGPGVLVSTLASRLASSRLFGIDPSPSMVRIARRRLSEFIEQDRIRIEEGDSTSIPFPGSFDLIVSTYSYHHWNRQQEGLQYLAGRLEKGGTLIIIENFRKKDTSGKGGGHHSLSRSEADAMEIEGTEKGIEIEDGVIYVAFTVKG